MAIVTATALMTRTCAVSVVRFRGRNGRTYPDMRKPRHIARLAIHVKILRYHRCDRHCDSHKAVLVNTRPHHIKPRQPAPRRPPDAPLSATALGEPVDRQHPRLDGVHSSEEVFLGMQRGRGVVAQQRKEGGNRKGLIAIRYDAEIDIMVVEPEREESRHGVDGNHYENADYAGNVSVGCLSVRHVRG